MHSLKTSKNLININYYYYYYMNYGRKNHNFIIPKLVLELKKYSLIQIIYLKINILFILS